MIAKYHLLLDKIFIDYGKRRSRFESSLRYLHTVNAGTQEEMRRQAMEFIADHASTSGYTRIEVRL